MWIHMATIGAASSRLSYNNHQHGVDLSTMLDFKLFASLWYNADLLEVEYGLPIQSISDKLWASQQ